MLSQLLELQPISSWDQNLERRKCPQTFSSVSGMNSALTLKTFGRKRTNLSYKKGRCFHLHSGILKLVFSQVWPVRGCQLSHPEWKTRSSPWGFQSKGCWGLRSTWVQIRRVSTVAVMLQGQLGWWFARTTVWPDQEPHEASRQEEEWKNPAGVTDPLISKGLNKVRWISLV